MSHLLSSHFRTANPEDISWLMDIEERAAISFGAVPGYEFCLGLPVRDFKEHLRCQQQGIALVGESPDGALICFGLALPIDRSAHILELAVDIPFQRQGLGKSLLSLIENWAQQENYPEITLTTFRDIPWNAPFYKRLGYTPLEVGIERSELLELISEEYASGFHRAPRIAMRKAIQIDL